jgi:ribosome maturation factor RimP
VEICEEDDSMTTSPQVDDLRGLIHPAVTELGLVLEDVTVTTIGRRRRLQIVVDLPEDAVGGVPVDTIAEVAREVSRILDDIPTMGETPYVLEVTSPGVDRPLTERRHWARARGRLVRAALTAGGTVTGRIGEVDEGGVLLNGIRYTWAELGKSRVEVEFSRAGDDPGDDADRSEKRERG